jgi:hypothetical protein
MIQPFLTDTVLIQGVTIINSPFWHLNPNRCSNVTVERSPSVPPGPTPTAATRSRATAWSSTGSRSTPATVSSCAGIWSLVGASAADPVGTITLDDLTITTSTAANSAQYVSNLVLEDVTVGGVPVTS